MQEYPVKRGHAAGVDLSMMFEAAFDAVKVEDGWCTGSFGTMSRIRAKYEGKTSFVVDTESDRSFVPRIAAGDAEALELAQETQRRWNDFLEGATGYDAKMRKKKAEELAKKSA